MATLSIEFIIVNHVSKMLSIEMGGTNTVTDPNKALLADLVKQMGSA